MTKGYKIEQAGTVNNKTSKDSTSPYSENQ